ncbi:MAG TPA: hypothetical protein VLD57_12260 [Blastocatellia bacterium]|nr:hypothetical protein [Blastocatellia bacterium]
MKKAYILVLVCVILFPDIASSQTRRRTQQRRRPPATSTVDKSAAEIRAARERVSTQIKNLSLFLYLFGGIVKGIESSDQAARNSEASSAAIDQNERNKARVKESLRNVRQGLEKLELDLRANPALRSLHPYLAGVALAAETAESQAAANRFDEAGKTLLKIVNQLTDGLAATR